MTTDTIIDGDSVYESTENEKVTDDFGEPSPESPFAGEYKEDSKPGPDRYAARTSGATFISMAVSGIGTGLVARKIDPPVGRYYQLTAPVCGQAIDNFIAGTFVDTILQPFFRQGDKLEGMSVVAGGILIAMYERAGSSLAPVLEPMLAELIGEALQEVADARRKVKTKQRRAARSLADIAEEFDIPRGADPVQATFQYLFQDVMPPKDEETVGAEQE